MSASDNLQPKQLKMFMSPNELKAEGYVPNPLEARGEDMGGSIHEPLGTTSSDRMMARKVRESQESGLYGKIEGEGVQAPVSIVTPTHDLVPHPSLRKIGFDTSPQMVGNGHHRLASQEAIDPDRLMPVMHFERLGTATMEDPEGDHIWDRRERERAVENAKSSLKPYSGPR